MLSNKVNVCVFFCFVFVAIEYLQFNFITLKNPIHIQYIYWQLTLNMNKFKLKTN